MNLQNATWIEIEKYLEKSSGIIIPIGSTEQHGPNGLIGTDAICPEVIANGVADKLNALVAPTINYGMAQHHLEFPGTIALRPSTLLTMIKDIVASLAKHGFRHLYFLNGHGGNIAPIHAGFSEFYSEQTLSPNGMSEDSTYTTLSNWWRAPSVIKLTEELYGNAEGLHATPSEVSLSYYARPDAVKQVSLSPEIAPSDCFYDAKDYRKRFPDGRIGSNPGLSSIEHGERIYHAAVDDVCQHFTEFCLTT